MLSSCGAAGNSDAGKTDSGVLKFEDGMAQPVVKYAEPGTPNGDSDIIRYCVNDIGAKSYPFADKTFDYEKLYAAGEKRKPAGDKSTMDLAEEADSEDWTYTVPGSQGNMSRYYAVGTYDYYLIRGFAVIEASGIGTYGSEGYELCGSDLERDSHYTDILVGWYRVRRIWMTTGQLLMTTMAHGSGRSRRTKPKPTATIPIFGRKWTIH